MVKAHGDGKWVYTFEEGNAKMRDLLGGKGAGLAEMTGMGLPVPPGFTVTTNASVDYLEQGGKYPFGLEAQVRTALRDLEYKTGKVLGDLDVPLFISVRSGAKYSMPGMMDTILNVGMNDKTLEAVATKSGDRKFALDSYIRLIQLFGKSAQGNDGEFYRHLEDLHKKEYGENPSVKDMDSMLGDYKTLYQALNQTEFPQDVAVQLLGDKDRGTPGAIDGVFRSWLSPKAHAYRIEKGISAELGTAVNIQAMVFGNYSADSGTGVLFTRDGNTGKKNINAVYKRNAQGEQVVSGTENATDWEYFVKHHPEAHKELLSFADLLEKHYRFPQDIEFTLENGKLFILQTRNAKVQDFAKVTILGDMVCEGLLTKEEAKSQVPLKYAIDVIKVSFSPKSKKGAVLLGTGLKASYGVASGKVFFSKESALQSAAEGVPGILVRKLTVTEDTPAFPKSIGVVTQVGDALSHAALTCKDFNLPCVVGAGGILVDEKAKKFTAGGKTVQEGDIISIDGSTGEVFLGALETLTETTTLDDLWKSCGVKA